MNRTSTSLSSSISRINLCMCNSVKYFLRPISYLAQIYSCQARMFSGSLPTPILTNSLLKSIRFWLCILAIATAKYASISVFFRNLSIHLRYRGLNTQKYKQNANPALKDSRKNIGFIAGLTISAAFS